MNRREQTTVAHVFESNENETPEVIFLVALSGHLRWAKPSEKGTANGWKDWESNMTSVEYHPCPENTPISNETLGADMPTLLKCKHCPLLIKTNLSSLTVGVGNQPWFNSEGKVVGSNENPPLDADSLEVEKYEEIFQRCQEDWREGVDLVPDVFRYLEEARKPYSPEQVERVAYAGTRLVQSAGGYVKAGMQIQEIRMRNLHGSRTTIEQYSYLYPAIADQVMEIFTRGVNPWMRKQKPPTSEEDTLPHQRSMTNSILKTMWEDVNEGFLFICHKSAVPEQEMIFPTCTGTVTKKNPDRTISEKLRIISDLRRVNLALRKEELFPVMTPTIHQIATRIIQLKRRFPDTEILLNKRDIAKAFKLIPINPHLMKCLCHVFKAETSATTSDILGGFLSLPFGWVASPSFFGLVTEVIQEIHQACGPEDDSWNLNTAYRSFLYVDDCMLVEPNLGTRPQDSVEAWERICKLILTEKSLNEEKAKIEGTWNVEHTLLGFVVNTKECTIVVPEEKIVGARTMILSDVFKPGNSRMALRDVQVLRGLCQHWLVSNWFWEVTLQTIDVLLAHADENSSYVTCIDADVWTAFWTLLEVLRVTAAEENRWFLLFRGTLDRLLPIEKRFSGPRVETNSLWITSDATLQKGGAVNWKNKQFLEVTIEEVVKPFIGDREYVPIIAEAELAIECLGFVTWTPTDQDRFVTFLGGDNTNAFSWIHNGKAKIGLGRDILAGFQLYVAIYALGPSPFYMRTHHNMTADFITRAPHSAIVNWSEDEGFTRSTIPWWWEEIARISQMFDWAGWLPKAEMFHILKQDRPLTLVEWGVQPLRPPACGNGWAKWRGITNHGLLSWKNSWVSGEYQSGKVNRLTCW